MAEATPSELTQAYEARLEAELARADAELAGSDSVKASGRASASLILVKGEPGPAEIGGGVALSGADGEAAAKALEALGRDPEDYYAVLSRPVAGATDERVTRRLRRIVEACDPLWIVAVDPEAASDVARALGEERAPAPGDVVSMLGRSVLALEGLEASLSDDALKRRVWAQMKVLEDA